MYTVAGGEFRRWGRENETLFQPLVLPLNKHLTLQLPRKSEIIINFTPTQQHHVKFTINNKLREVLNRRYYSPFSVENFVLLSEKSTSG